MASNFEFLKKYWPDMAQIGKAAESYLYADANACVYKLGLLAERAAQEICSFEGLALSERAAQADRLRALNEAGLLPGRIDDMFYALRRARNDAVHLGANSRTQAETLLHVAFRLCCWFMEVYGDWNFVAPEFRAPEDNTQSADFLQRLQAQEETLRALTETVEKIQTAASGEAGKDRTEKSNRAAETLLLTAEEESCIEREPIRLDAEVLPVVNYAIEQNGAAAVQAVRIENNTDADLKDLELEITANPAFALPFTRRVERIPAGETVCFSRPKLILDGAYLSAMTEKVAGVLQVRLKSEEKIFASDDAETTLLAFDEWHGIGVYPELLAAFVTPNHPVLAKIIGRATEFLGQWTGDTSMDGYQTQDPNRALRQAAAIFTAIKEQAIAYVVHPASFERIGQRVRLCDMVLQQKLGNCLDLTLLYASCLEAVGLRPLLIVTQGHIFAGVWLEEKMFPECVQDDVSLLTKRLASGVNELAVVETTCVTTGADRSFDEARAIGERNLSTQPVECIIDVYRARLSRISPLPQRVQTDSGWENSHDVSFREESMTAPAELSATVSIEPGEPEQTLPKKAQWERKLLDLGMRNTLINLRMTRTQLPILTGSLDALEDALADGSDFTIFPKPADHALEEFSFEALQELGKSGVIAAEFENKRLRSILTPGELNQAVKELYRAARTALEENGANTLYLALGMLRWFENQRSTRARYAPILLLPVELVRKSAAQGYVIRLREDEPQMNVTLLEKLKQDFGIAVRGVDPLPEDEHGVDIRKVLTILRAAVMEQPRWDVLETACIGIFSFSQFVMWNDIRNRADDLMRNKVVRSLIEGKLCWEAKPLEMGERVRENDVLLPMPADASQLYAIETACSGESFVLHGPPGTGKSQTITSLIANALAKGKSVLFVAEKMAALEVVQKRLESIGIGPFCLELHSNRSRKKDVLAQLQRASEVTRVKTPEDYAARAEQLSAMRGELDAYVRQLHRLLPCGSDLYSLINEYQKVRDAPEIAAFDRAFLQKLDKRQIEGQTLALERMLAAARETGGPHGHPLMRVSCTQYTQNLRSNLQTVTNAYRQQLERAAGHAARLAEALGEKTPVTFEQYRRLAQVASLLERWYDVPAAWARVEAPQRYFDEVEKLAGHAARANALERQLLENFEPGFLTQDGRQLFSEFAQISGKWFLPKMLGMGKLTKTLRAYAKTPVEKEDVRTHLLALQAYQQESEEAGKLLETYAPDLGALYGGKATDWEKTARLAAEAKAGAQQLYELYGSYDVMQNCCGKPELREASRCVGSGFSALREAKEAFDRLLGIVDGPEENWLEGQLTLCRKILDHAEELKEWIAYVAAAAEARSLGLSNVADGCEGGMELDALFPAYQKALLSGLICAAMEQSDALDHFSGAVFNKKIEQYKRMDQEWTQLSRQEIYCRLASKVPDFTREAAHSSELGVLQRCIRSGGRGVSIRKLFDQIPNLLPRLCPCMLMSPISAAQYLDPKRAPFDIVVFDEASQLPTCKAVGVLARGTDAVIVGDPKQMPPTSFFAANTVDEDNLEAEDLESILDDCLALNLPQSHLLWHYRSRHESLIAFSNRQFYNNRLLTFPSVNERESRVRFVPVEGVFDRGKTRTNRAEALAVLEEIKRRYRDPALAGQSIGVVTFNVSQQHLIDDLLTEVCAKDSAFEQWTLGGTEPLFIKNLENVQGDERDVILFSIGFGPDADGRVSMNFGPLNREGGWRRLNVAVSRARCEMMVFSALRPEQLDLNRTRAEGVSALRSFLEYAEGKRLALREEDVSAQKKETDGIAGVICKALREQGYETDRAVGRSAYRIDVGVIDPRQPGRYLLGILLDGDAYEAARTTRDREIAQAGVLSGLGWNILRVWSVDWWDNSEKELRRIVQKIQELEKAQEQAASVEAPEAEMPESVPVELEEAKRLQSCQTAAEPERKASAAQGYRTAALEGRTLSAEAFVEPWNQQDIQNRIKRVLEAEAPLSLAALIRRVVQSCGISRAGSRIQSHMNLILQKMQLQSTTQEDGAVFYWKNGQEPAAYAGFRVNGEGENRRDVRDIPVQEIANALCEVLYEQVSMGREDLLRETAAKLGYTRMGNNVLSAMDSGLRYAQAQGDVSIGAKEALLLSDGGTARVEAALQSL